MAEGTDKTRTDLKAEYIDEDDEAEVLGIDQHVVVNLKTEASSKNTHKEYKRHSKADTTEMQFSQSKPNGTHKANQHDSLDGGDAQKYGV